MTRQKYALILLYLGQREHAYVSAALADTGTMGIMSLVYGLHLANNGAVCDAVSGDLIVSMLLEKQNADGGFCVTGTRSDADVTAMVLQSLAPHRDSLPGAGAAIDAALGFLSSVQAPSGAYRSYGVENAESCAQVIIALCSLGIDPEQDARFIKGGCSAVDALYAFSRPDGSFAHTAGGEFSQSATTQAFFALSALTLYRESGANLYLKDSLPQGGTQPFEKSDAAQVKTGAAMSAAFDHRPVALAIVWGACLVLLIFLYLKGRRRAGDLLVPLLAAVLLTVAILTVNITSVEEHYSKAAPSDQPLLGTVALTVSCEQALGHANAPSLPADGILIREEGFPLYAGDTVYDVLLRATQKNRLPLSRKGSGSMVYVQGIGTLFELDLGDLSGWMYYVNGVLPSVSAGAYPLRSGDTVEWMYTLAQGQDLQSRFAKTQ